MILKMMNLFENLQLLNESENNILFKFKWEKGSINDNIIKYLQSKNIQFRYDEHFQLEAKIKGNWTRFDYETKHDGLTYVYIDSKNNKVTESSHEMEKYSYVGPVYRFDKIYDIIKEPIYTVAKSYEAAMRNICFKLKEKYKLDKGANLTIDKNKIKKDDEIKELTKEFERQPKDVETKIDDPKSNFDDPDSNEEYVVESILNFEDWLDIYFDDLVKQYADKYEMPEEDVYSEDEDFEEYVNDKYEEYYKNTNRYIDDEDLEEDFDINNTEQEYTSANTSINSSKLPAIFKLVNLSPNTINLDFGGGRFNNASEYLATKDVTNLIYDPYNRSSEHNKNVLDTIRKNNGADTATCSNVLNVIKEENARHTVIQNIYNLLKSNGTAYFTVYEGTGKGNEGATKSGYQLNRKTVDYVDEIKEVFSDVTRKGKLIIAKK